MPPNVRFLYDDPRSFFSLFFAISYRLKKLMLVFERIAELYILVWNRLDKFNFEDCLLLSVNSKSLKLGSNSFLNRCFHITFYFYFSVIYLISYWKKEYLNTCPSYINIETNIKNWYLKLSREEIKSTF